AREPPVVPDRGVGVEPRAGDAAVSAGVVGTAVVVAALAFDWAAVAAESGVTSLFAASAALSDEGLSDFEQANARRIAVAIRTFAAFMVRVLGTGGIPN
ncbi:MAG TPA: hypothetical protein VIJ90_00615, partial [Gemmatimonadaceae bacterium]